MHSIKTDREAPGQKSRMVSRPHLPSAHTVAGLQGSAATAPASPPELSRGPPPLPAPSNSQTHMASDFQSFCYLSHTTVGLITLFCFTFFTPTLTKRWEGVADSAFYVYKWGQEQIRTHTLTHGALQKYRVLIAKMWWEGGLRDGGAGVHWALFLGAGGAVRSVMSSGGLLARGGRGGSRKVSKEGLVGAEAGVSERLQHCCFLFRASTRSFLRASCLDLSANVCTDLSPLTMSFVFPK